MAIYSVFFSILDYSAWLTLGGGGRLNGLAGPEEDGKEADERPDEAPGTPPEAGPETAPAAPRSSANPVEARRSGPPVPPPPLPPTARFGLAVRSETGDCPEAAPTPIPASLRFRATIFGRGARSLRIPMPGGHGGEKVI